MRYAPPLRTVGPAQIKREAFSEKKIELTKKAGVAAKVHIGVGRQGEVASDFVTKLGAGLVVIGTRGHTGFAGMLLGSVAQDVIAHVKVPITLVK